MDTETLTDVLEAAGLSQYQAAAYVTLVELGSASVVELSQASGVPQARIYDVVRELENRGYVETIDRSSLHAQAHEPSTVVNDLEAQAASALDAAEELESRWQRPPVEDHDVSVVKSFETVERRAGEYVDGSGTEVQLSATLEQFRSLEDRLAAAVDRGVVVELSLHPISGEEPVPESLVENPPSGATEIRYRRFPSPYMLVVDRTAVCYSPEVVFHPANEYGMIINDYSLGHIFEQYFQTVLWEGREVVYSERDGEPPLVFTRVRECIRAILPAYERDAAIHVVVEGRNRNSEPVTIEGTVEDVVFVGPEAESHDGSTFADQATLVVDDGTARYEVGGYGAILEDVEADHITVEAIEG